LDPDNPDFVALAKAFGGHDIRSDSVTSFEAAIVEAFEAQASTLIEVRGCAVWLVA